MGQGSENADGAPAGIGETVDARGLLCPQPLLLTRAALGRVGAGVRIAVLADDPLAGVDLAVYCERAGHRLLTSEDFGGAGRRFVIEKSNVS